MFRTEDPSTRSAHPVDLASQYLVLFKGTVHKRNWLPSNSSHPRRRPALSVVGRRPPYERRTSVSSYLRLARFERPVRLLRRNDDDDDQRQDREEQAQHSPQQRAASLGASDDRAHDRGDDAADRDEDAFDSPQDEPCGFWLTLSGQDQFVEHHASPIFAMRRTGAP